MSETINNVQPGFTPAGASAGDRWREWVDRHAGTFFIAPAVTLILIFAIFPTIYSMVFALSRVRFTGDGLKFRYVGLRNFEKQFFGSSEVHFLGRTEPFSIFGMIVFVVITAAVLWWLYKSWKRATWVRMLGRTISAAMAIFLAWILCASLLSGNAIGTLYTTLFYVLFGCGVQFMIGTDQGQEFLSGAVLHSADGDAAWGRLCDADDRRHYQRAV
jgi:multiple sugar transport system permease protein